MKLLLALSPKATNILLPHLSLIVFYLTRGYPAILAPAIMLIAFSDGYFFMARPGDARRAIVLVAFGDKARCIYHYLTWRGSTGYTVRRLERQ